MAPARCTDFISLWDTTFGRINKALINNEILKEEIYYGTSSLVIREATSMSATEIEKMVIGVCKLLECA